MTGYHSYPSTYSEFDNRRLLSVTALLPNDLRELAKVFTINLDRLIGHLAKYEADY